MRAQGDSPAVCFKNSIQQILATKRPELRPHPDAINPSNARAGDVVYVTPEAASRLNGTNRKFNFPIQMRVTFVSPPAALGKVVWLEDKVSGLKIKTTDLELQGELYKTSQYERHAPFEPGEYVQIMDSSPKKSTQPGTPADSDLKPTASIARFLSVADAHHYNVEVKMPVTGEIRITEIPRGDIRGLATGTEQAVFDALKAAREVPVDFRNGEMIRYRDDKGLMQLGTLWSQAENGVEILDRNGQTIHRRATEVFKYNPETKRPATEFFQAEEWKMSRFDNPSGLVSEVLNGAARLTSHPGYAQLSPHERLQQLTRYTQRFIPWTNAGLTLEKAGLEDFNQIICAGAGVCRHKSRLLATILTEAGFRVRMVARWDNLNSAHAWLEVQSRTAAGPVETFVIDPSNGSEGFVMAEADVKAYAKQHPTSFEAKWYIPQEGRKVYGPVAGPSTP